jgi:hypothetical protein
MQINFLNQYYKARASDQNATDLVNMYLDIDNQDVTDAYKYGGKPKDHGKYTVTAYPTPGKVTFNTGSGSVVREVFEHRGVFYAVLDNKFYSYSSNGTRTERGTLSTSSGNVQLCSISNQIIIVDGTSIYNYNTDTLVFSTVTDPDAPSSPITCAAQNEMVLVSSANSLVIAGSDIADATSWSPLSFGSKTTSGDYIQKLVAVKSRIAVIGSYSTEIWYNNGAATFSFALVDGAVLPYGLAAFKSAISTNGSLIMLAQSKEGGLTVQMVKDEGISKISTSAIDWQINQLTTTSDATAYSYEKIGHKFYVLTFPTEAVTFTYDMTTGIWFTQNSYINGAYTREISSCGAYCYGKFLVGAYNSGTIYALSDNTYTENGAQIQRRITTPPAYAEGKKVFLDKLQIDTQNDIGSNKTVTMEISYDSGHTFANSYTGTIPDAGGRMYWTRLGMTQDAFVIRLTTTMNANFIVLGAWADISKGIH